MKKKILMFGPARGHNIQRYLDVFQRDHAAYTFSFANYHTHIEFNQQDFPQIEIFNVWNLPRLLLRLWRRNDIVWIHMFVPIPLIFFILIFRNRSSVLNFSIWGESIPRLACKKGLKPALYRFIMRYVDHVMCPWYATFNIIDANLKGVNAFVHPMGMNGEFFDLSSQKQLTEEARSFISKLPQDKVKFYFPKSFSAASNHDLIISASKKLIDSGIENFVVYFWMGNQQDANREQHCLSRIKDHKLEDHIPVVHHSYLPTYDIQQIWKAMDAGLQIANNDLLSTTILEPMLLKMEFIATDIPPYQIIQEKYNVDLALMPMDENALYTRMKEIIEGCKTADEIMEKRKEVVEKYFNTYVNVPSIVDTLIKMGKKRNEHT